LTRGLTESVLFAPKPRAEGSSPSAPAKKNTDFSVLFSFIYGDFTCFSHIDKIKAHGFFRTPLFHFHTVFCSLCATQFTQSVWYIIKKASITSQIR